MKILFDQIPLDQMSVSMTMNGAVIPVMAFFIVAAEEQGVPLEQLSGTIQNDILKEFMVRNTYIYPPLPSMRIIGDIFAYHLPAHAQVQLHQHQWVPHARGGCSGPSGTCLHPGRWLGVPSHRAGSAGMAIDDFAPRLSFFWGIGMNHFMEIAKLRAGRVLWAKIVKHLGAMRRQIHGPAHPLPNQWIQPDRAGSLSTILPVPLIEATAAVLGHTQSLHTNSLDEAMALPTDFSARIARNTQLFLQYETDIRQAVDPWGGSYYVEYLTGELIEKAWTLIEEVENLGGMAKAIETGLPKMRIEEAAARKQARIDSGKRYHCGRE